MELVNYFNLLGLIFVKINKVSSILPVFTHTLNHVNWALYQKVGKYDSGFV